MDEMYNFVEDRSFFVDCLMFMRDDYGRAMYQKGLHQKTFRYRLFVSGPYIAADTIRIKATGALVDHLDSISARYAGCVLLDNDDAFFRNMVPPHATDTFMALFDAKNMYFTPEVSPPPCRLNFPFLVGKHERDLISDLHEFITNTITTEVTEMKIEGVNGLPFTKVVIQNIDINE